MQSADINMLEKKLDEIHQLVKEAIETGIISDRNYEAIKDKIGKMDAYGANESNTRVSEIINKADAIYKILAKAKDTEAESIPANITGDYIMDDNSFTLSQSTKEALRNLVG